MSMSSFSFSVCGVNHHHFFPFLLYFFLVVFISRSGQCHAITKTTPPATSTKSKAIEHTLSTPVGDPFPTPEFNPPNFTVTTDSLKLTSPAPYDAILIQPNSQRQPSVMLTVCIDKSAQQQLAFNLSYYAVIEVFWQTYWPPHRVVTGSWNMSLNFPTPAGALCLPKNKQGSNYYNFPLSPRFSDQVVLVSVYQSNSSESIDSWAFYPTGGQFVYYTMNLVGRSEERWRVLSRGYDFLLTIRSLDAETFNQTGVYGWLRTFPQDFARPAPDRLQYIMAPINEPNPLPWPGSSPWPSESEWPPTVTPVPFRRFQMIKVDIYDQYAPPSAPISTINITDTVEMTRAPIASNLVLTWSPDTSESEMHTSKRETQKLTGLTTFSRAPMRGLYQQCISPPVVYDSSKIPTARLSFVLTRVDPFMLGMDIQCVGSFHSHLGNNPSNSTRAYIVDYFEFNRTAFGFCSFPFPQPVLQWPLTFTCDALLRSASLSLKVVGPPTQTQNSTARWAPYLAIERVATFNGTYQLVQQGVLLPFGLSLSLPPIPNPTPVTPQPYDSDDHSDWIADPMHKALVICVTVIATSIVFIGLLVYIKKKKKASSVPPPAASQTNQSSATTTDEVGYGSTQLVSSGQFHKLETV